MGKKKNKKEKKIVLLTESERRKIINDAVLKAYDLNITITAEMWKIFNDYISTGKEYKQDIEIPNIKRTMIIDLRNVKGKQSVINLKCDGFEQEDLTRVEADSIDQFNKAVDNLKDKGVL